jgi:hypothetical protein
LPDQPEAKRGRPSLYAPEIVETICERLAAGETLRAICRDDDMPSEATVRNWALDDTGGFFAQYTRARDVGYAGWFDEIREIADTPVEGTKTVSKPTGTETTTGDMIEHRRLQIDARKWMLSKALPKVYGDRLSAELSGPNGGPIETTSDPREIARRLAFLLTAGVQQPEEKPPLH